MAFLFLRFRISFDYIPEDIGRTREQHFASRTKDAGKCWTLEVSCYSTVTKMLDQNSYYVMFLLMCLIFGLVVVFKCKKLSDFFFLQISKWSVLQRYIDIVPSFYQSTVKLMGVKVISIGVLISIIYWFMECMIFYSLLAGFDIVMSLPLSIFVLTTASIGGGLSLMPGSVGALEGGLIGLLVYQGIDFTVASGVTLLHRFFAMWDVVMIGAVMLLWNMKYFKLKQGRD